MGIGLKLLARFVKKILGGGSKLITKFKKWKLARHSRKELQNDSKLSNYIKNVIAKDINNKPLTVDEKTTLQEFEKLVEPAVEEVEVRKIKSKSGNFIMASYYKKKKKCVVLMKRGVGKYTFNNVPITAWLALCDIGGKYMWDRFGKKYSTNPSHWQRKSVMLRPTTANYTRTKKFRTKYKGKYY